LTKTQLATDVFLLPQDEVIFMANFASKL